MSDKKAEKPENKVVEEKDASENTAEIHAADEHDNKQEELDKAKKDYLYLYAEFENYRKKAIQERSQTLKYANENILRELLQIMDNFKLATAMEVTEQNLKSFVDGVNMISHELDNLVNKFGITKVTTEKEFDPNIHEAVSTEEDPEASAGSIIKVFKEGYKYHDRLLRPAQVVIASESSQKE